jgi:Rieske Fe-S protein
MVLAALLPGMASDAVAATKTTKPTPTPKKKKPSPTPTAKKPTPSKSPTPSPSPSKITEGIVIAKSSELAIRQIKVFFIKDSFGISTGYSLTRTSRGVVMAFDSKCTHAGVPTSVSGSQLKCPAHGSIFNPENGEVIRGPAVEPLKSYRTIEADGEIRIVIS